MGNGFFRKSIAGLVAVSVLLSAAFFADTARALTLTDSENVSVSASVGSPTTPPSGGNTTVSGIGIPLTAVTFSGYAYPSAAVTLLREGLPVAAVTADADGLFAITLPESYDANVLYTLYAVDLAGQKSLLINYPIAVHVGFLTTLSGIRFAPTISTDKAQVKAGDYLTVTGYALPRAGLQAVVNGITGSQVFTLSAAPDGTYAITIPLGDSPRGDYTVHVKYAADTRISKLVKFSVGNANIYTAESEAAIPGDCNADRVVNLVDFSVLAFWYGKDNPPACVDTNHDHKIDLVDFSILAFYWTG